MNLARFGSKTFLALGGILSIPPGLLLAGPLRPRGPAAVVLHRSSPASLAVLDLASGRWLSHGRDERDRALELPLPVPESELARCQTLEVGPRTARIWIATDTWVVRLLTDRWQFDRRLRLPEDAREGVVDLVAWTDGNDELLALAVDGGDLEPAVIVLDTKSGDLRARYTASAAGMSRVSALHREGDVWTLVNRRRTLWGEGTVLTGLAWHGGGFSELASVSTPDPGANRGETALTPIAPGIGVVPSTEQPLIMLVDLTVPTGLEPHPYVEWTIEAVAAAADPELTNRWGAPQLFVADAAYGEILALDGLDGEPRGRIPAEALGVTPSGGSHIVVSASVRRALMSSPLDDSLLLFDPENVVPLSVIPALAARPESLLLVP